MASTLDSCSVLNFISGIHGKFYIGGVVLKLSTEMEH